MPCSCTSQRMAGVGCFNGKVFSPRGRTTRRAWHLPYTTNNKGVHTVRHALAIDERRSFFQPMPWGLKHQSSQDIKQVWFAGVHSDVGGGYPEKESQLSKIPLNWMIDEATGGKFGLLVDEAKRVRYVLGKSKGGYVAPNSTADRHESSRGIWWLVQFHPRSAWLVDEERQGIRFPPQRREIESDATLHRSVIERMAHAKYSPENLQGSDASQAESNYAIEEYG